MDTIPERVLIGDRAYFFKTAWAIDDCTKAVEKYAKIEQAGESVQSRTSRLYGIVLGREKVLSGQLYHWLDINKCLTWDVVAAASLPERRKWAEQVQRTVQSMHAIDVVWGDVKPGNVVIDVANGDAVVIDFEGGATRGWVDQEIMETKAGDMQGLGRLVDYILNDSSALRQREKARYRGETLGDVEADAGSL